MHIQNLEAGLRRTMVNTFRQRGANAQVANTLATQNLSAADAIFHEKYDARQRMPSRERLGGPIEDISYAMRAVAAWAHSIAIT